MHLGSQHHKTKVARNREGVVAWRQDLVFACVLPLKNRLFKVCAATLLVRGGQHPACKLPTVYQLCQLCLKVRGCFGFKDCCLYSWLPLSASIWEFIYNCRYT